MAAGDLDEVTRVAPIRTTEQSLAAQSVSVLAVTAPAVAVLGATESVDVTWSGLTAGVRYLGRVEYSNGADLGGTLVAVHA